MVNIKDIPVLTGEVADRFIRMSEDNLLNKGCIDFTDEYNNSMLIQMKRKIKQVKVYGGGGD